MLTNRETSEKKSKRKMTEKQLANLKPFTKQTAAKSGRNGGLKSVDTHAKKRTMREILDVMMSMPSKTREGMTNAEAVCAELLEKALEGNLRATELLRDTIGQKPTERDNNTITGNVIVQWQQNNDGVNPAGVVVDNGKQQVSLDVPAGVPALAVNSNPEG